MRTKEEIISLVNDSLHDINNLNCFAKGGELATLATLPEGNKRQAWVVRIDCKSDTFDRISFDEMDSDTDADLKTFIIEELRKKSATLI